MPIPPPPTKYGPALPTQQRPSPDPGRRGFGISPPPTRYGPGLAVAAKAATPPPQIRSEAGFIQRKTPALGSQRAIVIQRSLIKVSSESSNDLRDVFSKSEIENAPKDVKIWMNAYNITCGRLNSDNKQTLQVGMIKLLERISGMLGEQKNSIGKKVYSSIGDDQLPTEVGALFASSKNAPYYVFPTSHGLRPRSLSAVIADGKFVFAIALSQPNEIRVGRGGDGVGHASLTGNKDVLYAGTVTFKNGKLLTWNNDTGHYHTQPEHASQAQIVPVDTMEHPLLPEEKFEKFKY